MQNNEAGYLQYYSQYWQFLAITLCIWWGLYIATLPIYRLVFDSGISVFLFIACFIGAVKITGTQLNFPIRNKRTLILFVALGAGSCLITIYGLSVFADSSYDGNAYHLPAILSLMDGWNPFKETHQNIWVNSYPNGYWSVQATLAKVLTIIPMLTAESARISNFMLIFSSVGCGLYWLRIYNYKLTFARALLLFAIAINPVTILQSHSFMLDGAMYSLFLCYGFLLASSIREPKALNVMATALTVILLINIKMSAVYFACFLSAAIFLIAAFFQRSIAYKPAITMIAAALFALLVAGFKPFVTNIITHGSLMYPPPEKLLAAMVPAELRPLNRTEQFATYFIARTHNNKLIYKFFRPPTADEILSFIYQATPFAGFGAFFGWLSILGIVIFCCGYSGRREWAISGLLALAILVICYCFIAPWLSRFIAPLWLFPLLLLFPATFAARQWLKVTVCIISLLAIGQNCLAFYGSLKWLARINRLNAETLSRNNDCVIESYGSSDDTAQSWQYRLKQQGIECQLMPDESCAKKTELITGAKFCLSSI